MLVAWRGSNFPATSTVEVEGAMIEADQPLLPLGDGRCPVVIIDTSGDPMGWGVVSQPFFSVVLDRFRS